MTFPGLHTKCSRKKEVAPTSPLVTNKWPPITVRPPGRNDEIAITNVERPQNYSVLLLQYTQNPVQSVVD